MLNCSCSLSLKPISSYRIPYLIKCLTGFLLALPTLLSAQNHFLENGGRLPKFVKYTKQSYSNTSYYTKNGYTLLLKDQKALDNAWHHFHKYKTLKTNFTIKYHRIDVEYVNSLPCDIQAEIASVTRYNYFLGNEPSEWATGLRDYYQITYKNLYQGIDWQVVSGPNSVKHNYIVQAGFSPEAIKIRYKHQTGITLDKGQLKIQSSVGTIQEQRPFAFQIINGDTSKVECVFQLKGIGDNVIVSFKLGKYDVTKPLIIDPILVFSTYSGSKGDNFGFTSTYDSKSHLYAGGIVDGGTGTNGGPFPVTPGAFQITYAGGIGQSPANLPCDIGINKYDSAGTTLLYSTYLGGSRDEYPHSLVVDNSDNLLVMGTCYSPDFPMDTAGYDLSFNGKTDIFIVKLKEDGSELLASTFFGGTEFDGLNIRSLRYNYADDFRGDIVVDALDNVYVASTTSSTNIPTKNAFQGSRASAQDGCVFSLNSNLDTLRFSTYLGGNDDDAMYSVRLYDTFVYIGGGTASNAMAFAVSGHKNAYSGGTADGFIAKLSQKGKLISSSYFGTSEYDQIYFLDIDASGQVYAAGQTEGNLNRTAGTYGKNNTGQFIVRYTPNIALINLSTTFGYKTNDPEISPSAFLVDKCDNIYFSGWGSPITDGTLHPLTTRNLQVTPDAIQSTTDDQDFYLLVLSKDASSLLYATYYGGNLTEDHVDGGTSRFDKKGVVYQSVCSSCPGPNQHFNDFPVSANAPFKTNLSPRCSNASFKIDFQINYEVDAKFIAQPQSGCEPLKVNFINQSRKARHYTWNFGDGSPIDTSRNPVHTYTKPGKYKVKLTCLDSFSCNISESDSTIVEVKEMPKAAFEYSSKECSREFEFKNNSENAGSYEWDFGDTTPVSLEENPKHTYVNNGNFRVLLTVKHPTSGCIDTQSAIIAMFGDPLKSIKIPNVFTPNKDNNNDCYTVSGISPNCEDVSITIYDRWGLKVFEGILPKECWNGRLNNTGPELSSGIYYYILNINSKNPGNQKKNVEGVIHLIR